MSNTKVKAVIDSSFWININKIDLAKYLLDYFELYSTEKVREELLDHPKRELYTPKDADLFKSFIDAGLITLINPLEIPKDIKQQLSEDSGEIYILTIAKERNMGVLLDDNGPLQYCEKNKIRLFTSIHFVYILYRKNIISKQDARDKIIQLKKSINSRFTLWGLKVIEGENNYE